MDDPMMHLQANLDNMQELIDQQREVLHKIKQWCEAYPVDIFQPLSDEELQGAIKLLRDNGYSTDALYAQWGRHILGAIHLMIMQLKE